MAFLACPIDTAPMDGEKQVRRNYRTLCTLPHHPGTERFTVLRHDSLSTSPPLLLHTADSHEVHIGRATTIVTQGGWVLVYRLPSESTGYPMA
jgi:hypothetical protein